jgi:hypothetical protein
VPPEVGSAALGTTAPPTAAACRLAAVATSERLAEAFGDVAEHATNEEVLIEALRLQEVVVGHLALLAELADAMG